MIRKLTLLLTVMILLSITIAVTITLVNPRSNPEVSTDAKSYSIDADSKLRIVTTIYPVYMIGLNIADQIDNIEVKSLINLNTGCLHDYQLTTKDMKLIASADILVINGGGMESFLEDIKTNYPKLKIIDASQGIPMLSIQGKEYTSENSTIEDHSQDTDVASDEHNTAEDEHDHGTYNPHVWLDPQLYIKQVENVRNGLIDFINENSQKTYPVELVQDVNKNADIYIEKIQNLDQQLGSTKSVLQQNQGKNTAPSPVVIFHDAFAYLAKRMDMPVAFAVTLDSDTSLSAGDIADIIDDVKKKEIKNLFTEQQYSDSIAKQIEEETGAKVSIIDSVVTGDGNKDSYLDAMKKNLEILQDILK